MLDEDVVWVLALLVKLHRGDRVSEAALVADRAAEAFREREEKWEDD